MKTIVSSLLALLLLFSCRDQRKKDEHAEHNTAAAAKRYTCAMHPQIVQDAPGTCPICGMALVELTSTGQRNDLMLSESQVRLANITTQKASKKPVGETLVINGTLTVDEERTEAISSRASGRIEKLYIKETGQSVAKGDPLYVLYSEALLTLQQEYLLAKDQYESLGKTEKRYKSFMDAAERKLILYGLTKSQVDQLTKDSIQPRITLLAPAGGIVTAIKATEGQYVDEGGLLYELEDVSTLWVEAELYSNEAGLVKRGDAITVRVSGYESMPVEARVTFFSPEYRSNTQILVMRAEIKNPGLQFKPGQQAQVFFTHSAHDAISIPIDAVIRDGKGSHVYIQSGHNTFQPRMVKTGLEGFDEVEITEGLSEGDTVAVTGAYLLYSEIILKKGTDPMAGHSH